MLGFAICAVASVPLFSSGAPLVTTLSGIAFAFFSGVVASAVYAAIPSVVPKAGSAAIVIGIVSQAGGIATLVGPPAAGTVIDLFGWQSLGLFLAATAVLGLVIIAPMARLRGPEAPLRHR